MKTKVLMLLCGVLLAPAALAEGSTSAGASISDGVTAPAIAMLELAPAGVAVAMPEDIAPFVSMQLERFCHETPTASTELEALVALHRATLDQLAMSEDFAASYESRPGSTAEGVPKHPDT